MQGFTVGGVLMKRSGLVVRAFLAMLLGAASMSGCTTAFSSHEDPSSAKATEPEISEGLSQLFTSVDSYEAGAQIAAANQGPAGLAKFTMDQRTLVLDAALSFAQRLDASPGDASDQQALERIAVASAEYGVVLLELGNALDACDPLAYVCWEGAYEANPNGSAIRQSFRDSVDALVSMQGTTAVNQVGSAPSAQRPGLSKATAASAVTSADH